MTNPTPAPLTGESAAVQSHLGMVQAIVTRMATNSVNCKTWCISLVSAILVIIADKGPPDYAWIALIPVVLFLALDAYYLGQERAFRDSYNHFVRSLHDGTITPQDLFVIRPMRGFNVVQALLKATLSFAVYPFYLTLAATIAIARFLIL
jgi:hypothetical protein